MQKMFRENTCNLTVIEIIHVLLSWTLNLSFGALPHKQKLSYYIRNYKKKCYSCQCKRHYTVFFNVFIKSVDIFLDYRFLYKYRVNIIKHVEYCSFKITASVCMMAWTAFTNLLTVFSKRSIWTFGGTVCLIESNFTF